MASYLSGTRHMNQEFMGFKKNSQAHWVILRRTLALQNRYRLVGLFSRRGPQMVVPPKRWWIERGNCWNMEGWWKWCEVLQSTRLMNVNLPWIWHECPFIVQCKKDFRRKFPAFGDKAGAALIYEFQRFYSTLVNQHGNGNMDPLKMYLLLKWWFSIAMLVYRRVLFLLLIHQDVLLLLLFCWSSASMTLSYFQH